MITIKEIALLAKVSPGTVDRVIHNRAGVSVKTATRIRTLLKDHNFKLNDVASKLANRKKYNLATLLPSYDDQNLFWKSPYLGIQKAKEEIAFYGIQTNSFLFDQYDAYTYLQQFDIMMEAQPDAVVLVPTFKDETKIIIERLEEEQIPYLFLNTEINNCNNLTFIGQDSIKSGMLAAKLLHLSLGNIPEFLIVKVRKNINNYHAISNRIQGVSKYFKDKEIETKYHNLTFDTLKNSDLIKKELSDYLDLHPNIKGIYIPSSQISKIVASLDAIYLHKLILIGHDTTESNLKCLKEESITFLISQKSFNQGYDAALCMSDFLLQNKKPSRRLLSPIEIVTFENYDFDTVL